MEIQTKFIDELIKSIEEFPKESSAKEKLENAVASIIKSISNNKLPYKIMIDQFYHFPKNQQEALRVKGDRLEHLIRTIIKEGIEKQEFRKVTHV